MKSKRATTRKAGAKRTPAKGRRPGARGIRFDELGQITIKGAKLIRTKGDHVATARMTRRSDGTLQLEVEGKSLVWAPGSARVTDIHDPFGVCGCNR